MNQTQPDKNTYRLDLSWTELAAMDTTEPDSQNDDWTGVAESKASLDTLRTHWPLGVSLVRDLPSPELPPPHRARVRDWNQGDTWDQQRADEGLAAWTRRVKRPAPVRTVRVNVGESGGTPANSMLYKAYTALQIVDALENQGSLVKVVVESYARDERLNKTWHVRATVKNEDEPTNLGAIVTAAAPWALRRFIFGAREIKFIRPNGFRTSPGHCVSQPLPEDEDEHTITIDRGE